MGIFKNILTKILIFITAAAIMAAALVVAALIPKNAIRQSLAESAQFMASKNMYTESAPGIVASCTDHYSDSILLNIIYSCDSSSPLRSVMNSAYYHDVQLEENENLLEAVTDDREPNLQYLRYWHGSTALLRPVLTVLSIRKIYILNSVIIAALATAALAVLLKSGHKFLAFGVAVSVVMVRIWFVPLSLEYFWTFMIMFIACMAVPKIAGCPKERITSFFLVVGIVTNFLDFLTTETITLLVPLLVLIYLLRKKGEGIKSTAILSVRSALSWLCGYAFMWMAKWAVAAIVLHENVMPYVTGHIANRFGVAGDNTIRYYIGAVTRNFGCLFPLGHGFWGIAGFALIVLIGLYFVYVYRMPGHGPAVMLYACVGLVPIVRYLVLHNHSYIHFFFTYRALASTVLAAILIIGELIGYGGELKDEK